MSEIDTHTEPCDKDSVVHAMPVYVVSTGQGARDELSLADFWRVIARRWMVLVGTVAVALLMTAAYLYFAEPSYRAVSYLLPPRPQDIQGLLVVYGDNEDNSSKRYTPETVFQAFLENARSQGLRREFFGRRHLLDHYVPKGAQKDIIADAVFEKDFNSRLKIDEDPEGALLVRASFSAQDPELAASWLNDFIAFANRRTVEALYKDLNSAIHSRISAIQRQIQSRLKLAERRRLDRITKLEEARQVAESLGIRGTSLFPAITGKTSSGLAINTAQIPLYMRGADALETEIQVLQARKSDEPFVHGIRDLQEKLAYLEGISVDIDSLSAVSIDAPARRPFSPSRPRPGVMLLLAATLGSVVGLFLIFAVRVKE